MQSWLVYYEDMAGRKSKTFNPKRFTASVIRKDDPCFERLKDLDVRNYDHVVSLHHNQKALASRDDLLDCSCRLISAYENRHALRMCICR